LTACPADPDDTESGAGTTAPSSTSVIATEAELTSTPATATTDQSGGDAPACMDVVANANAFIASNNACTNDEDCGSFNGFCFPGATCGGVAVNVDADESQWNAIHDGLEAECSPCGADPCGACSVCDGDVCRLQLYECGETTSSGSGDDSTSTEASSTSNTSA
jgi:hypothetical protein